MLEPTRVEPPTELLSSGRLLALYADIRQGWKLLTVPNGLAYYDIAIITTAKKFCGTGPCGLYYKHITIVNDDSRVVSKRCSKLWITIVNDDSRVVSK
jgi:hypothetical protein